MTTVPLYEFAATFGLNHHNGREIVAIWKEIGVDLEVIADWRNQPALTVEMAEQGAKAMFDHRAAHQAKEEAYRRYQEDRRAKKIADREALARQQLEEQERKRERHNARAEREAQERNARALAELQAKQAAERGVEFADFDPRRHTA